MRCCAIPIPTDWLMMRGNYQGWGFSTLDQINKANVKGLQLVWARVMEPGINEATPIVYKGVMYLGNPNDVIQAIDAAQRRPAVGIPPQSAVAGSSFHNNSGASASAASSSMTTRSTPSPGTISWWRWMRRPARSCGKSIAAAIYYATNTTGPIVVNGVVIAGSNCQEAPFGCYVTGNDAQTGKELWRNTLIPKKGEPGDETWARHALRTALDDRRMGPDHL